ncbi:MAG: TIGR03663 family protein [Bacteriovoracaceae bacterium]
MKTQNSAPKTEPVVVSESYFNKREWIIFTILILVGLSLRWIGLDNKPFHHDEGLHAIFGRYIWVNPDVGYYKYDPLLHGPLMYNLIPIAYSLFGDTNWAARSFMCFFGSFLIFVPLIFRRLYHKTTTLFLTLIVALSPGLIYWSRFLREDSFLLSVMIFTMLGYAFSKPNYKSFFIFIGIILQFCIKENAYITCILLAGYLIFESSFNLVFLKKEEKLETYFQKIVKQIKSYPGIFILAVIIGIAIYIYLFSAGFRHPEGILDGIYRKSIGYWINQHSIERIAGPFIYPFLYLTFYETIFLAFTFIYLIHFYLTASRVYIFTFAFSVCLSIICFFVFNDNNLASYPYWHIFKLKLSIDFFPFFISIFHAILLTVRHLKEKKQHLAFWGYLFFSQFFTYSLVAEKVPWLATYPQLAGLIYLAFYFEQEIKKIPKERFEKFSLNTLILVLGITAIALPLVFLTQALFFNHYYMLIFGIILILIYLFNAKQSVKITINLAITVFIFIFFYNFRISLMTNFKNAGRPIGFISQVHTTHDFQNLINKLHDEIAYPVDGVPKNLLVINEPLWPTAWFFRDIKNFSFNESETNKIKFKYIIENPVSFQNSTYRTNSFNSVTIPLRCWWVPDYEKISFESVLTYTFFQEPWNSTGCMDVSFSSRK